MQTLQDSGYGGTEKRPRNAKIGDGGDKENSSPNRRVSEEREKQGERENSRERDKSRERERERERPNFDGEFFKS